MATPNAVNNNLNQAGKTNNKLSISQTVLAETKKAWDQEIHTTGDPCKNKDGTDSIAVEIEKLFIRLKAIQKYGDFILNTVSNSVENIQSTISAITSAIAGILKSLVQRLRNWVLNKLKALIEQALTYIATNLAKELKKAIVNSIIDQIFCAFEEIIGGLVGLVGDFLYSLIGQIINTPICAVESWLNALTAKLVNDIDNALAPIFDSINDILSGVGTIAGSVYEAIDFILGLQGFLCGAPNCPEVTKFKLGPWGGPTKSFRDDFSKLNFDNSFVAEGAKTADGWLEDFFGPDSGTLNQSPGSCYTGAFECGIPQIEIFGGGGSGAVAQAVVNTIGEVVGVNLLNGGSGYDSAPFVSIVDPAGCGQNASAYAVMQTDEDGFPTGVVDDVVLNNPGYDYDDNYNGGAPVITSFSGAPNPLVVGNNVALSWNVTNADTVSLGIAGYNDLPLVGSISIPVSSDDVTFDPNSNETTITYTLTATKDNTSSSPQTTTRTFILTVLQDTTSGTQGSTNTNPPVIDSFTASDTNVNPGDIITLSWETTNATSASLDVTGFSSVSVDGSVSIVIPSEIEFPENGSSITNTYTLTATNSNAPEGSQTATQTVSVEIGEESISTTPGNSDTGGGSGDSTGTGTGAAGTGTGTGATGGGGNTSGTGNNDAVAVLDDIDIIGTGIGYTNGDTVSIEDDTGSGATAQIQTNQLGQIVSINVLSGGYGFTRIPQVRINSFAGAGAKFRPKLKFIPINQFLLEQELQVIDPNKLVQVVDCVTR